MIRVIGGHETDRITALAFGPYDNGYILAGMASGKLLVFDPVTLERVKDFHIFTSNKTEDGQAEAVTQLSMEPTELVFVATQAGSVAALSIVRKEMHYVYLDLGNRQYCTVAIPKGTAENLDHEGFDHNPLQPLFDQDGRQAVGLCCI